MRYIHISRKLIETYADFIKLLTKYPSYVAYLSKEIQIKTILSIYMIFSLV